MDAILLLYTPVLFFPMQVDSTFVFLSMKGWLYFFLPNKGWLHFNTPAEAELYRTVELEAKAEAMLLYEPSTRDVVA